MKANYDNAKLVMRALLNAGHQAFLAGGCVRDMQLGLLPNDFDITTSATPEQVQACFDKTISVGASFGVVKVIVDGKELDVATFRTDGFYSDNRRPDTVAYTVSAEEDVKRRDFTINALLMDINGEVIDYVNGLNDLKGRVLKTVGNAGDRFEEDALRMMRAIRFAVRFRLDIDEKAWLTIKGMKGNIKNISKERVTEELSKMFCYGNADRAYFLMRSSGLWEEFFGLEPNANNSWLAMLALQSLKPTDPFILALAIIYKEYSYKLEEIVEKFVLTCEQKRELSSLLIRAKDLQQFMYKSLAEQRKIAQWENFDLVEKFISYQVNINSCYKIDLPIGKTKADYHARLVEIRAMGWPGSLITGDDLIAMGFVPGQVFTKMLELVRNEQLEGRLLSKEQVKPFLISKFPAAPRKLDDGTTYDDTGFRRVVAQCPHCSKGMSCEVPKTLEGNYIWGKARAKINMRSWDTRYFCYSTCHNCKRKKSSFVEVKI